MAWSFTEALSLPNVHQHADSSLASIDIANVSPWLEHRGVAGVIHVASAKRRQVTPLSVQFTIASKPNLICSVEKNVPPASFASSRAGSVLATEKIGNLSTRTNNYAKPTLQRDMHSNMKISPARVMAITGSSSIKLTGLTRSSLLSMARYELTYLGQWLQHLERR